MKKFKEPIGEYHKSGDQYKKTIAILLSIILLSLILDFLIFLAPPKFPVRLSTLPSSVWSIASILVIFYTLLIVLSPNFQLVVYENGFKLGQHSLIALFSNEPRYKHYLWDDVHSYSITHRIGNCYITIRSLTITLNMNDGTALRLKNFQGDDFSELAYQILPTLVKNKRS